MRFLHTSDWHLGRLFHNVSLLEDQAFVLDQIVAYATEYDVDAVLIAGDIFDRAIPPAPAIELLDETLHRLTQAFNIPVVLISGNHDSAERLAFGSRQLANQNLHIQHSLKTSHRPIVLRNSKGETAAIYGIPYHTPEAVRSAFNEPVTSFDDAHSFLVSRVLAETKATDFRLLMSHCFVDGAEACESERPLAVGGVDRVSASPMKAFDYVALGHLHGQQKRGAEHIRYSGSPMKYSFSEEKHAKGVTLVELEQSQPAAIKQLPLSPLRNMRSLTGEFDQLVALSKEDANANDFLAVTLTDSNAILDAMAKLREVYPNILQLDKVYLHSNNKNTALKINIQNNESTMFSDFFKETTGNAPEDKQVDYITKVLNAIHKEMNEESKQ